MLQKNLKYILLTGVAIIWGAIIYKLINGMYNENSIISQIPKQKNKAVDKSLNDSYRLLANYTDPFGADDDINLQKLNTDSLIKASAKFLQSNLISDKKILPKTDLNFIRYKGTITNPLTKKVIAIISINGKDEFVAPKTIINNIKVNTIKKDKINISYLKVQYWIKRL